MYRAPIFLYQKIKAQYMLIFYGNFCEASSLTKLPEFRWWNFHVPWVE